MSELKRYEVIGRLETDGGATEEYPGPDALVVYASELDAAIERARAEERQKIWQAAENRWGRHFRDVLIDAVNEADSIRAIDH